MANRLEILKEIKNLVFSAKGEETIEAFKDAKLGEMIIRVEADEFAEGLQVLVVTEDGVIPASPDMAGEHLLEDGTKLTIDESGVITKVEKTEEVAVEEPVAEEMAEEEVKVEDKTEEVAVEDLEDVKEEIKDEVKAELAEEVKEEMAEEVKEDVVAELASRVEKLESAIEEMLALSKEANNFSKVVEDKLNTFIKDTPADLEFKSIKSEYKSTVEKNVTKAADKLEEIRKFRTRK